MPPCASSSEAAADSFHDDGSATAARSLGASGSKSEVDQAGANPTTGAGSVLPASDPLKAALPKL